jgi:hypothetical protein
MFKYPASSTYKQYIAIDPLLTVFLRVSLKWPTTLWTLALELLAQAELDWTLIWNRERVHMYVYMEAEDLISPLLQEP